MKAAEDPKACCFIVIKAAITRAKHTGNYYGAAEFGKALAAEEIAGTTHPPNGFLGVLKPSGCQEQVISHLLLASARSRNTLPAITIATGRTSITSGYHHWPPKRNTRKLITGWPVLVDHYTQTLTHKAGHYSAFLFVVIYNSRRNTFDHSNHH